MMSDQGQAPVQEAIPEVPVAPEAAPKAKQYLLMVDELGAALMARMCPGIQMVQVEGINMQGSDSHVALVTPIVKPIPQPMPIQAVEAPKID